MVKEYIETSGKNENINYMIVTQDLVNNSILSIWLWLKGRGIVCKFSQNGKFGKNGKLGHSCDSGPGQQLNSQYLAVVERQRNGM